MNRGSHWYCEVIHSRPLRFNEAPIHESGKWRSVRAEVPGTNRFNEAPIHESGK